MRTLEACLHFDGNCREVLDFYRSVFGGDHLILQTFGDGSPDMVVPESEHHKIMHATLNVGDGILMGSDIPTNMADCIRLSLVVGNNISLSYSPPSKADTNELFAKLSARDKVTMPPREIFWGTYFGTCTDRFGIHWQLNCNPSQG
ncbi:MAG: hypothetical protein TE42_00500 [Candidatus Synechococcus spongiarum SP3]|uniref:PhnB-like domain-containing protein n=1 Tax=Candidatus Synechococcus spongiarum SP3 TaxID=1604020 RepID=A0A0G2IX79_9SYNE|nr:MAG: hypothetical protein TE42_00500 [Candidatus Synechococcus spongiarum SP3]